MKKRFVNLALVAISSVSLMFGLTACGETEKDSSGWGNEYTISRAYALAVEKGYGGTLEEFIESISGKDGKDGTDGKSAYEIWLANGYKGTQADFIESITGKDGTN
ncbi:MAG: hypothetical protein K2J30_03830, partial [Clostridia bacterium]|nr:hypothetical protein [Clostridia bacterium]